MTDSGSENKKFDSGNLLYFFYRWRKPLSIIMITTVVFSFIFSSPLFIVPKYKSTVILYPSASSSISRTLLADRSNQRHDILEIGQDSQVEHMLQILNSGRIRNKVVERFNLKEHYGITPDHRYVETRLQREYSNNISFRRTEFMAVKINVLDKDAVMAAEIANYIGSLVDSVRNQMQKDLAIPVLQIVEQQFLQLQDEIRIKEDSLTKLRHLGIHEYESQAEMLNQQLAIEVANNNKAAVKALEDRLKILSTYGSAYVSLRDQMVHDNKQLSILRTRFAEARVDAEQELPFKFLVDEAVVAEKKSYPIRWLIVVLSTFGALFVGVITLVLLENFSEMASFESDKKKTLSESFAIPIESKREGIKKISNIKRS